jgi:hypothetical protein
VRPFLSLTAGADAIWNFLNTVIVEPAMRGDQRVELLAKRRFLRAFAIIPWSAL